MEWSSTGADMRLPDDTPVRVVNDGTCGWLARRPDDMEMVMGSEEECISELASSVSESTSDSSDDCVSSCAGVSASSLQMGHVRFRVVSH
jgi:hypothetical protein